jgi:hypothetical protein
MTKPVKQPLRERLVLSQPGLSQQGPVSAAAS